MEPQQLATPEPQVQREHVRRAQPVATHVVQELLPFRDGQPATDPVPRSLDLHELGDVALHQLLTDRVLERVPQHRVQVLDHARRQPTLAAPLGSGGTAATRTGRTSGITSLSTAPADPDVQPWEALGAV
ncbi:hypothetical protein ACFU3E_36430 [Streptomyces sp. NPDC057424]|uniref:hypothetical protein n=1 Tax=Streptomyces sp. NPDC057424 TaxID=3346127 RepID=UPI003677D10D